MSKPGAALAHADGDARTRVRWSSRRPFRRIAAILTSLALGAGIAVVGVAAPASAHTGDLKASAVCNTETGKYDVTYTLTLSNVPSGKTGTTKWRVGTTEFDGTPKNANGMDRGPISTTGNKTITLGTEQLAGDTTNYGPWVYAYTTWNGATKGSDGQLKQKLAGDCGDETPVKKIEFCHATGSASNPYVRIETAVEAFYNAGHIDHEGDIWPAFSYTKHGKVISVPAQGDQSLLQYEDCAKPIVKIPVEGAPMFSDTCGSDNEKLTVPEDTARIDWNSSESNGVITVTATAKPGYEFKKGEKTTWTFTIDDKPCVVQVVGVPAFSDKCGADNEKLTVPEDTATIDWTSTEVDGVITVTATAKPGNVFPEGATKTWTFTINDAPCIVDVVGEPTFSDTCGADNEKLTVPEDTDTIDWNSSEENGTITVTATAKPGSEFPVGAKDEWTFVVNDAPCAIELVGAPEFSDTCGPDNEKLTVPADTDTIDWDSVDANGVLTVTATAKPGYAFPEGGPVTWTFPYSDADCIAPSLTGSVATGTCVADSPWIFFDVKLSDPDKQSTGNTASLVMTDGTNTETIVLGDLKDGSLKGEVLWPGASVDENGTANGWPGWALVGDKWIEVDDNFAWTRGDITAQLVVNPELDVAISYPPASPNCATGPKSTPGGEGGTPAASNGTGLASTGFAGTSIAIVAGIIVIAGVAFLVVARIRRKRA